MAAIEFRNHVTLEDNMGQRRSYNKSYLRSSGLRILLLQEHKGFAELGYQGRL